jgi:predicted RNase H-like HicB family nuclease/predicted RNA binding protein YcfA (HicA-like mRNA interferase family)
MPLKVREVIRLQEKNGWRHVRRNGDNRVFRSADGRITVISGGTPRGCPAWDIPRYLEANWNRGAEAMTRTYSLVIEGDSGSYSAYVPELPTILVTGTSIDDLSSRAIEAIRVYWESLQAERSPTSLVREIEVELQS